MNAKYRALVWEQSRVAGPAAAFCALFALLSMFFLWAAAYRAYGIHVVDARSISEAMITYAALALGGVLTLRQAASGQLAPGFDPRHARLPVRTLPLVTVQFTVRLLSLLLLCAALGGAYTAFFRQRPETLSLLLPVSVYLVAQTLAWSYRSVTGISYMLPAALFLAPALLARAVAYRQGYFDAAGRLADALVSPAGVLVLLPAAYALSLLGVHWERRDERHGLPTARDLRVWLGVRAAAPAAGFGSALAAQVWLEWRRTGWMLPAVLSATTGLAGIVLWTVPVRRADLSLLTQFIPLALLPLAAVIAGAACLWDRTGYAVLRPVRTRDMARAKLLAMGRALTHGATLAAVLSIAGFAVFGRAEFGLLRESLAHGETTHIEIATLVLGPCLLAVFAAWVALWLTTRLMALLVLGPAAVLVILVACFSRPAALHTTAGLFWVWAVTVIAAVVFALAHAVWRGWMTRAGFVCTLGVWAVLAGVIFAIGPKTGGAWPGPLLACIAISAYAAAPFAAVPAALQRGRAA
jgi:hypothetical protein